MKVPAILTAIALSYAAAYAAYRAADVPDRPVVLALSFAAVSLATLVGVIRLAPSLAMDRRRTVIATGLLAAGLWSAAIALPTVGVRDNHVNVLLLRGWLREGRNPYTTSADELRDDPLYPYVQEEVRGYPTFYGPLHTLAGAIPVALLPSPEAQLVGMKVLMAAAYLLAGFWLWRKFRSPQADVFFLAWLLDPAAIVEIGNVAHNEGLLILPLSIFAVGLSSKEPLLSVPGLAAAALVKYWPVALLPALFAPTRAKPHRWAFAVILSVALGFAAFAPFVAGGLDHWKALFDLQTTAASRYSSPGWTAVYGLSRVAGIFPSPAATLATGVGAAILVAIMIAVAVSARRSALTARAAALLPAAVLFGITLSWLQPWHLLSFLPLLFPTAADDGRRRAGAILLLSCAGFLSYALAWPWIAAMAAAIVLIDRRARIKKPPTKREE